MQASFSLGELAAFEVFAVFQEEPKNYVQELVEDFVEIVASFASRIYGKRSRKYKEVMKCI